MLETEEADDACGYSNDWIADLIELSLRGGQGTVCGCRVGCVF